MNGKKIASVATRQPNDPRLKWGIWPGPYPSRVPPFIYELLSGKGRFSLVAGLSWDLRREVINDVSTEELHQLLESEGKPQ